MDKIIKIIDDVKVSWMELESIFEWFSDFWWINEEWKEEWNKCWKVYVKQARTKTDKERLLWRLEEWRAEFAPKTRQALIDTRHTMLPVQKKFLEWKMKSK